MSNSAVRSLLRFSRIRPWAVPMLVVLGFVASLMEGVGIGLMIPLLDVMMGADGSRAAGLLDRWMQQWAGVIAPDTKIFVLCVAIFLMILVKTIVTVTNVALGASLTAGVTHDLRIRLARRLLEVSYLHFIRRDQGQMMNVLEAQTYRTAEAMALLVQLLTSASAAIVFVLLLLLLSWQLTALVVVTSIPVSLLVRWVAHRASDLGGAMVEAYTQLAGRLLELLTAMRTVRVFGLEAHELKRIEVTSGVVCALSARSEALTQSIQPAAELLYTPVLLAALLYGWFTDMPLASLLAFLLLAFRLPPHLKRVDHARVSLGIYAAGVAELETILKEQDEPALPSGSVHFEALQQDIVFDRVSFRHAPEAELALDTVSFRIPRQRLVAIVGRSGSGKSTVLNLLCRLYDPTAGSIRVDGRPLPEYDLGSWRRRLALSGQDVDLMGGTVRENIEYGVGTLSDAELQAHVVAAHADEFLQSFPDGLETDLGARGLRLSGGQRQRIALARALARRPELLILDEATNALDEQSEAAIRDTIAGLADKCTIVIVAHRLELVSRADHVVVLAGGRVVAEGPPERLQAEGTVLSLLHGAEARE